MTNPEGTPLTIMQAGWARMRMERWLRTKFEFEPRGIMLVALERTVKRAKEQGLGKFDMIPWKDIEGIGQLGADAGHSALLDWLLTGHDPLPEPPPLQYSYPVYPWEQKTN